MSSQLWYFYTTSGSFLPITQLSLCTAGLTVNHKLMRLLFCLVLHPEGEIILQFFHIIFQRCCFGSITNPAVTVFHSSQACVCVSLCSCLPIHNNLCTFHLFICTHVDVLKCSLFFFLSDNVNLWSKMIAQFLHWVLNSSCNNFIFYKVHFHFYELGY